MRWTRIRSKYLGSTPWFCTRGCLRTISSICSASFGGEGWRRVLPMNPAWKDREVPDVHRVLLPKVCFELWLGDLGTAEMRPGPVVFPVHDRHQLFSELVAGQGLHSVLHCIAITDSLESA